MLLVDPRALVGVIFLFALSICVDKYKSLQSIELISHPHLIKTRQGEPYYKFCVLKNFTYGTILTEIPLPASNMRNEKVT